MSSDLETPFLDALYKDLALALGNAVWAFARIEWTVYKFIGRLSKDGLDELVGEIAFRQRCSILTRIVERRSSLEPAKVRALAAIKNTEQLAERRNIIVHNPLANMDRY
ncbi:MAG TPA: hypothetical protein VHL14_00935 [Steroidobacteraceae bacterium]|jgi:hypothetical protein|nr:hypothetical protein [Steroidobacteraceae bacterium]